jgi:hypothetical protein
MSPTFSKEEAKVVSFTSMPTIEEVTNVWYRKQLRML